MASKDLPTPEFLRQLLRYEPETGKLFWLPRPRNMFTTNNSFGIWNNRFTNKAAFTSMGGHGYLQGSILNRMYLAHRVIFAMMCDEWPKDCIDHINRNRLDNSWANLRAASRTDNARNKGPQRRNSSGVKGVSWSNSGKCWVAHIKADRRNFYLGRFDSITAAADAYEAASGKHHGAFGSVS